MASSNWTNKWIILLLSGIIIQAIAYPFIWVFQLFSHEYLLDVFIVSIASVLIQFAGFLVIISKTKDEDPNIYGQGRPFQHKLREEDEDVADRKPTYAEDSVE